MKRASPFLAALLVIAGLASSNATAQPTPEPRAARDATEYYVFEIYLNAPPERNAEARTAMQHMVVQLGEGIPFEYLARTYSEATTRATGGDLGWNRLDRLPPHLAAIVRDLPMRGLAGPIPGAGDYSIVYLEETRPAPR